ncbi:uncharacterized protein LOC134340877 [Mobula hypostoma]|uniref:uncharacterized protein LOC134340877 n=1 Tax=Mobula hypostoma TaxID=723540 RepID=UPI002FC281CC
MVCLPVWSSLGEEGPNAHDRCIDLYHKRSEGVQMVENGSDDEVSLELLDSVIQTRLSNPNPRLCPNGTYSDQEGLEDVSQCIACPAGMYCYSEGTMPNAISQPTGYCPKGHFCPVRTGNPFSFPCKRGFYQSNSAAEGEDSCSQCPTGHYCDTSGLEKPKLCPKGFYCTPESREKPQPCERGTYSNSVGLGTSSACTPCGGGQYCTDLGLTQPTGYCKAGFYCRERATTAAPVDGITGDVCTAGGYCPVGSAFPVPCPMGTFSNTSGLRSSKECLPCPPGLYCSGLTTRAPTGPCRPGYFCTGGASSPTQHSTKEGHYSRVGAESPEPCPLGTFQSGHYLHQEGAADISSCTLCDPGMYCSVAGLSAPEGPCRPGYYCTGGSNTSIPVAMPFGDICPAGYYCPLGTKHAFENPCPAGTWSNFTGAQDIALCLPCTPGFSCSQTALTHPNELCSPGFYCKNGAKTSRPLDGETGDLCPKGYYCPEGTTMPIQCEDGSYNNATGQERCSDCPPGFYCVKGHDAGFVYRLLGQPSHLIWITTQLQTVSAQQQLLGENASQAFTVLRVVLSQYHVHQELTAMTQVCQNQVGNVAQDIIVQEELVNHRILMVSPVIYVPEVLIVRSLKGCMQVSGTPNDKINRYHYSDAQSENNAVIQKSVLFSGPGSKKPTPCPPGTFSDVQALSDMSECLPCAAGFYCESPGLTAPTNPCSEGFYCPPGQNMSWAFVCPAGHYCPEGSPSPELCDSGTWQDLEGQGHCKACEAGYYCDNSIGPVIEFKFYPCPQGYYCPVGTRAATQYGCPPGTFGQSVRLQDINDCQPCSPGKYCASFALKAPSGELHFNSLCEELMLS